MIDGSSPGRKLHREMAVPVGLKPDQVFVFGSNASGFHGAGSAGLACRGESANNWRSDAWFLRARAALPGSPNRVGRWAIFGVARGFQVGREGKSYAIQTCEAPGRKRSTSLAAIEEQLVELFTFAEEHPGLEFLMTPVGAGLAGYSLAEMKTTFARACQRKTPPNNIVDLGDAR